MTNQSRSDFGSAGDVARLFHVSPKTVARWCDEGRLPHSRTLGGHRRFALAAVRDLVARTQPKPEAEASSAASA